ncbi:MAG TPA: DUF6152 family protein [Vicinamibacterales bacterium]
MRQGLWVTTLTCLLSLSHPAAAHHSVGAQFDASTTTTLTGAVVRVEWRSPHVVLAVKETSGSARWDLSTHPPAMLLELGVTKGLLAGKPGETITATIHPALNGRRMGWVTRLTYSDGHSISLFEP